MEMDSSGNQMVAFLLESMLKDSKMEKVFIRIQMEATLMDIIKTVSEMEKDMHIMLIMGKIIM
jgi:hypothetical protein